jgi:cell division protein FtsB
VNKTLVATAVAALIATPAMAQQRSATLNDILAEIQALSKRVEKLEQDNKTLSTENAELKAQNEELEATTEYLKDNAKANRKELAEAEVQVAKVPDLEKNVKSADWATKIKFKGDFRFRYENIEDELASGATATRSRNRIRVRFGAEAKVNDTTKVVIQLATAGDDRDPRSTNQTLGEGLTRKNVGFDLAYADWAPIEGLNVQLGKVPYPWVRVASYFWDGDLTWEGGDVKYQRGGFFGSAFGFWLSERGAAADSNLFGGQLGYKGTFGSTSGFTVAAGYFDVGAVQDTITLVSTAPVCAPNPAFFGGAQGNLTYLSAGCRRLQYDFNMVEALAQYDTKLGKYPLVVFGDFIQNLEADTFDTGWSAGITFGKASDPMTWELGYIYQDMEQNAQFAQFLDSDFGGGISYSRGSVFKAAWAPAKNWVINGTYFVNERVLPAAINPSQVWRDYDRLQIDFNWKY